MPELTLKSAKSLYKTLGLTIQDIEIKTDEVYKAIEFLRKSGVDNPLILNSYYASLYLNFINLDICAIYRLYLIGLTNYEQRFAVKQLYTIMNEGYKRLYGFDNKTLDPNKRQPQNGSVWSTYLLCYKDCGNKIIEDAYQSCLSYLEKFNDPVIFNKEYRCHGAHYNSNHEEIYTFLCKLNAEEVTKGTQNFFGFMAEIGKFISIINSNISIPKSLSNEI